MPTSALPPAEASAVAAAGAGAGAGAGSGGAAGAAAAGAASCANALLVSSTPARPARQPTILSLPLFIDPPSRGSSSPGSSKLIACRAGSQLRGGILLLLRAFMQDCGNAVRQTEPRAV